MSLFFAVFFFIHLTSYIISRSIPLSYLIVDATVSCIMFVIYKIKYLSVEIVFSVLLSLWGFYAMTINLINPVVYSVIFAYAIMLVLKEIKVKAINIIILAFIYSGGSIIALKISNTSIENLYSSFLVTGVMSLSHYLFYYSHYKEPPNIKDKYKLSEQEMLIIECLFKKNPSNKNIAGQLYLSEATIKADLGVIYKKFGILSGGSKKTELVAKLVKEGFYTL